MQAWIVAVIKATKLKAGFSMIQQQQLKTHIIISPAYLLAYFDLSDQHIMHKGCNIEATTTTQ